MGMRNRRGGEVGLGWVGGRGGGGGVPTGENMAWKTWGAASWALSLMVCPSCCLVSTLNVTAVQMSKLRRFCLEAKSKLRVFLNGIRVQKPQETLGNTKKP